MLPLNQQLAQLWRARERRRMAAAMRETFQGDFEPGRKVYRWLLRRAHVLDVPIVPGDPIATGAAIGERNLVLQMLAIMGMDENEIVRAAQKEALTRDDEIRDYQRDISRADED